MVWKRGEREKEKVCLVADLLVGDWLIWLKVAIESRQYLSFIKIILQGWGVRKGRGETMTKRIGCEEIGRISSVLFIFIQHLTSQTKDKITRSLSSIHPETPSKTTYIFAQKHIIAGILPHEQLLLKDYYLIIDFKINTIHSMDPSDSESPPLHTVILHQDEKLKKDVPRSVLRRNKEEPSSQRMMQSADPSSKTTAKPPKEEEKRGRRLDRPIPLPKADEQVSTKMYSFTLARQRRPKSVSDIILKQRIRLYFKQSSKPKESKSDDEVEQGEIVQERRRQPRYFDELLSDDIQRNTVKCYRCGKKGHISSRCIEEKAEIKCYFCTLNHHCKLCTSSVLCNLCGETGHIEYECSEKEKGESRCRRCKKKGHQEGACGVVLFQRGSKDSPLDHIQEYDLREVAKTDLERVRCLNDCKAKEGHFRCYTVSVDQDSPYEGYGLAEKYNMHDQTRPQIRELDNY